MHVNLFGGSIVAYTEHIWLSIHTLPCLHYPAMQMAMSHSVMKCACDLMERFFFARKNTHGGIFVARRKGNYIGRWEFVVASGHVFVWVIQFSVWVWFLMLIAAETFQHTISFLE